MKFNNHHRKACPSVNRGFSLVELMVVISIMGLLSGIVLSSLEVSKQRARGAQITSTLKEWQKALELYRAETGTYPGEKTDSFVGVDVFDAGGNNGPTSEKYESILAPLAPKYIASIPHYPTFPGNTDTYVNGFFEYETDNPLPPAPTGLEKMPGDSWYCGGTAWTGRGYVLLVGSPYPINLPPLRARNGEAFTDWSQSSLDDPNDLTRRLPWYYYCITSLI